VHGLIGLARLSRGQWRSAAELGRRQLATLKELIRHAYETVPFYRDLYDDHGVTPADIKTLSDLRRFPVVTRQQLQATPPDRLVTRGVDPNRCLRSRTSGSTGVPLEILFGPRDRALFNPSFLRVYLAWGLRPWHRTVSFQARPERLGRRSWYQRLGIFRNRVLFSRDDPEAWIEALRRWRPRMIHGYSLTLKLLAEALDRRGVDDLRVPLVTSTSGVLDDGARRLLERTLGASVVDIYASDEAGSVIAWECPRCTGYHLCTDTVATELLVDGSPARPGEDATVVITNLTGRTMPFIRYDQGDVARPSDRAPICGRGQPLLEGVRGRAGDFIVLGSGRRLTPHPFFLVLDHALGVGRWQIVQEEVDRLRVTVTMPGGHAADRLEAIRRAVSDLVEADTLVEVEVVNELERSSPTKLRSVISRLPAGRTPDDRFTP
jgi:phenylacetate-CoA ligase